MSQQIKNYERDRRRGCIIYFLYFSRPKSLELGSLIYLLDTKNFPITRQRLAADLDFLRDAGLVRITTPSSELVLSDNQQERFLHKFAESDGDCDNDYCARLTNKGLQCQEGNCAELGVVRVS